MVDQVDISGLGRRLRFHRRSAMLTQEQLAAASGVPQSTLSAIERGAIASPSADTLAVLANVLGVSVMELLADAPPADAVTLHGWSKLTPGLRQAIRIIVSTFASETVDDVATDAELEQSRSLARLTPAEQSVVEEFRRSRIRAVGGELHVDATRSAYGEGGTGSRVVGGGRVRRERDASS